MKVFVAEWGDGYGHGDVLGVFTTRTAAETFRNSNSVEEFDLNEESDSISVAESRIRACLNMPTLPAAAKTLLEQALTDFVHGGHSTARARSL